MRSAVLKRPVRRWRSIGWPSVYRFFFSGDLKSILSIRTFKGIVNFLLKVMEWSKEMMSSSQNQKSIKDPFKEHLRRLVDAPWKGSHTTWCAWNPSLTWDLYVPFYVILNDFLVSLSLWDAVRWWFFPLFSFWLLFSRIDKQNWSLTKSKEGGFECKFG